MPLLPQHSSPLEDVWVALDLETTGLSFDDDEIIEVGAVKFQGRNDLETYQTFINPNRRLSDFIKGYTGIGQEDVDRAPSFPSMAGSLASFIGLAPIVGHNLRFDLGFLDKQGLRLSNPRSDTWDIAYVLFPELQDYSLPGLAGWLKLLHPRPHRALDDAVATKDVFLQLVERMSELDSYTLAEIQRLSTRSSWNLSYLLSRLETHRMSGDRRSNRALARTDRGRRAEEGDDVDVTGLSVTVLNRRLKQGRRCAPTEVPLTSMLSSWPHC